jgi:flagellar basal-body rod modification protein FlgD
MVSNVGRTLDDFSIPTSQRATSEELGQDDFLKLIVEQMRNQNPLDPQDNSEFFSQIAQFQSLDAMQVISKAITRLVEISGLSNASSMIGREVVAEIEQGPDPDTGFPRPAKEVSGLVDRVTFDANGAVLHVGDLSIPASAVTEITDPVEPEAPTAPTTTEVVADVTAELLAQLEALGVLGPDAADGLAAGASAPTDEGAVDPAEETGAVEEPGADAPTATDVTTSEESAA